MEPSPSQSKLIDSSTTGNPRGKPEQIGSHLGALGSGTLTDINAKLKAAGEVGTQFQQPSTVTDRFYVALKAIYGTKFSAQFATAAEVHQSKAMWGPDIDAISEDKLRACLKNAKRELMSGSPNYQWPNLGLILGHATNNNDWERQCHKIIETNNLIEDKTAQERRCAEGLEKIRQLRAEAGL